MTRDEVISAMLCYPDTSHPAWEAFISTVFIRACGDVTQAWVWFANGWEAAGGTAPGVAR